MGWKKVAGVLMTALIAVVVTVVILAIDARKPIPGINPAEGGV